MKQAHILSRLEWFSRMAKAAEDAGNHQQAAILDARIAVGMRYWMRMFAPVAMLACVLVSSVASASQETTANRYVREQGLTCVYAKSTVTSDASGRLVVRTGKVCTGASK